MMKPKYKHINGAKSISESSTQVDCHNNTDKYTSSCLEKLNFGKFNISKKRRSYEGWMKGHEEFYLGPLKETGSRFTAGKLRVITELTDFAKEKGNVYIWLEI